MGLLGDEEIAYWEVASRSAETIAGHLAQLNADLIALMAEVLASNCWAGGGINSPEHWLQLRMGISPAHAGDIVAVARRKGDFPELEAKLAGGSISLDQLVVVARHVPTRYARAVTQFVENATVSQLRRVLPRYRFEPEAESEGATTAPPVSDAPQLTMRMSDGRFTLRFEASATDGALVENALREAKDALFTAGNPDATLGDALLEMAGRSLQAVTSPERRKHYQVLVHLDVDGNGWLNKRGAIPPRLLERLTCDAAVQPVWMRDAKPVSVGRSMRIVPDRTRRLIEDRDAGCRFPGCPATRFLENHHLIHWSRGGATDFDTLISLCPKHHREHHQGEFTITGDPNRPTGLNFSTKYGLPIAVQVPPNPPPLHHPPPDPQPVRGFILDPSSVSFTPDDAGPYREAPAALSRAMT